MRVAVLSPVWFPVPPSGYGGIEWIVSLLADGLADAGHDVTLFASGDSRTRAKLAAVFEEAPSERIGQTFWELQHALNCFARHDDFDVIHDHTGLMGLALGSLLPTPLVHTVHGPVDGHPGDLYEQVVRMAPQTKLISLSLSQREPRPQLPWIANIPNALDLSFYPYHPVRGDYLLFLGRMSPDKGAHRAVAIALEAGLPLKIAGKCAEPAEQEYFDAHVRPHLGGDREYVGEVTHGEKVELLQNARATVFPISWQEPFGLVMIESMACGTPVIATRWGAVPEVIDDGVTGIIVDDWRQSEDVLDAADALDPAAMRRAVEEQFTPERMVADYVDAYQAADRGEVRLRSQYDREILRLAVPALGALAAEPSYILVDTAVVGHLGRPQLAALGVSAVILTTLFAIFNFLQYGTTAQVGRASGAGQEVAARRLGAQALWLCLAVGIVLAAAVAVFAPQLVELMGADDEAADYAVSYLRIVAIGLPSAFIALGSQGYLRGVADLRTPFLILAAGNAVNIVLNVFFVYGLGWGIEGSAAATAVGQTAMGAAFVAASAALGGTRPAATIRPDATPDQRRPLHLRPHRRADGRVRGRWSGDRRASATRRSPPTRSPSSSGSSSRSCSTRSRSPARCSSAGRSAPATPSGHSTRARG